ncbi:MAG: DUF4398 domain-containing protein [Deltaproteobacteria bacterium]|nr:DUF4398 domain-containing protein [Deltaproteobacteria bacterium]
MKGWPRIVFILAGALAFAACAPIEYSVVIVEASQAIAEAEVAGAACTQDQLDKLSPMSQGAGPNPSTPLVTTEGGLGIAVTGPRCDAPYEYYSALEYLHKAREEVGYSEYEPAIEYAREARTFARKARDIALNRDQERGR